MNMVPLEVVIQHWSGRRDPIAVVTWGCFGSILEIRRRRVSPIAMGGCPGGLLGFWMVFSMAGTVANAYMEHSDGWFLGVGIW